MRRSEGWFSSGRYAVLAFAVCSLVSVTGEAGAQTQARAQAQAQAEAPAGQPLRARVEAGFEVLPISGGLLLRPRQDFDGIRTLEVREGDLAIDGESVDSDELEKRVGRRAAAPVVSLLSLDGEELHQLFGFARNADEGASEETDEGALPPPSGVAPVAPAPPVPPVPPGVPDLDAIREQVRREMERSQGQLDRAEEYRSRIEREVERRAEEMEEQQRDMQRDLERAARRGRRLDRAEKVVMGTPVRVDRGESSGQVVSIGGSVTVDGEVDGDAVAVGGVARIDGTVTGDVIGVGGGVRLGPNARVLGEVISVGAPLRREPGAQVLGQVTEVTMWEGLTGGILGGRMPMWGGHLDYFDGALADLFRSLVMTLILMLLGSLIAVVAPGALQRSSQRVMAEPVVAGIVGLLGTLVWFVAIVLIAVVLTITIIGIPLLVVWVLGVAASVFAAFFGYFVAANALGEWAHRRFGWRPQGAVKMTVLGIFFLHFWWVTGNLIDVVDSAHDFAGFLVVLLLFFWWLLNVCAFFVGIGGLMLNWWRGRSGAPAAAPPLPPLPPTGREPLPSSGVYGGRREVAPVVPTLLAEEAEEPAPAGGLAGVMASDLADEPPARHDWDDDPFAGFQPPRNEAEDIVDDLIDEPAEQLPPRSATEAASEPAPADAAADETDELVDDGSSRRRSDET